MGHELGREDEVRSGWCQRMGPDASLNFLMMMSTTGIAIPMHGGEVWAVYIESSSARLGSTRLDSTGLDWIGLELMRRALEWMEDSGFSHVKFYFGVWGLGFG